MIRFKRSRITVMILSFIIINVQPRSCSGQRRNDCPKSCDCFSTIVNCANKNFRSIPPLPEWTELLYMNDNPLETFSTIHRSTMLDSPTNLTFIDFTRTKLRNIDDDVLDQMFNDVHLIQISLVKLKFDENDLSTFPLINHAFSIRSISLTSNKLSYDSIFGIDVFGVYPRLESLDLSFNSIRRIPTHFLCSPFSTEPNNLTHLLLNNNGIEIIEENAFELFTNLKLLRLSRNNILVVSKSWIGQNNILKELDLNFNQINKIDILAFEHLKSLQILKMKRNKLDMLPDGSFWGLSKLQKLHLDHNNISEIREGWTYGLETLKELTIKHNSISKIANNSWNSAHSLIDINLNYNNLDRIERKTFEKLTMLRTLKLSNNHVSYVDEHSFRSLKNLRILDLSFNKLSWTIESSNGFFLGLKHLAELRLDNNLLRLIFTHTFNGLQRLKMLNLTSNPISSIQNKSFEWFEDLQELYMDNIDLLCDCTMKWLSQWLRKTETNRQFARGIHCKHPHELAIRTSYSFLDVDPDEFKCQDFLKPYLLEDFQNITKPIAAIKNKDTSFYCKVATSSDDGTVFKWFKDNQIIDHQRAIMDLKSQAFSDNVTHYTSILHLVNIQDEDQGKYHCMASNSYGSVYSHKFPVNVYVAPYFIKQPQNVTVRVGQTAKLECSAKGQPIPIISWQKDGGDNFPAAMERRMHVMHDDHVFFIVEVKKNDMGSYSCHAVNDAGSIVSTVFLNVIELPSFVRKMVNKKATVGSTVSLECMAAGIPMPQVAWFKDGQELRQSERHFFTAGGQLLIIVKLKSTDRGVYACNISNNYGAVEDSSYLEIINNLNPNKNDNLFSSFWTSIRAHALYVLIIVSCVLFTSLAWIVGICYIRHSDLKTASTTTTFSNHSIDHSDCPESVSINFDQTTKGQTSLINPKTFDENECFSDINSESSSALDTGIEESCQSYEEESEFPVHYPRTKYHSLPRKYRSIDRSFNKPYMMHGPIHHSSLPRRSTRSPRPLNHFDHFHKPSPYLLGIPEITSKTTALSSKEKKRLEKKRIHHKMMIQRSQAANINNIDGDDDEEEEEEENLKIQMQMQMIQQQNDRSCWDHHHHPDQLNRGRQPTMMTFQLMSSTATRPPNQNSTNLY